MQINFGLSANFYESLLLIFIGSFLAYFGANKFQKSLTERKAREETLKLVINVIYTFRRLNSDIMFYIHSNLESKHFDDLKIKQFEFNNKMIDIQNSIMNVMGLIALNLIIKDKAFSRFQEIEIKFNNFQELVIKTFNSKVITEKAIIYFSSKRQEIDKELMSLFDIMGRSRFKI